MKRIRDALSRLFEPGKNAVDMHIVYTVLSLILLGLCILFTSSMVTSQRDYNDPYFFLKKQSAWAVISLVFFAVFSLIPYKIYQ
ncbi:MAG TPA: FtsW/RodA/SpoVE family cell cycle protein, partial [Leptospiraceae bacterium]|nr:FtsW/RodA/SpoVE family cell cycle protein [Leptospiraceae bacterium]